MKKLFITFVVLCTCLLSSLAISSNAFAAPGDSGEPHQISNCEQLQDLGSGAYAIDDYYVLSQSFSCDSNASFAPLFYGCFEGNFDGQGNTISNLHVQANVDDYMGLFACVDAAGTVENVGMIDADIDTENYYAGALVGYNIGTVENSYSTGTVSGIDTVGGLVGGGNGDITDSYSTATVIGLDNASNVGGLIGGIDAGTYTNSYATGNVSGGNAVGGFVGYMDDGNISDSYATGDVDGSSNGIGGFLGQSNSSSTIVRSWASGDVTTDGENVGGFVGYNGGEIRESYATGDVSGDEEVGGFTGENAGLTSDSYARGSASGVDKIGGFVGYRDCGDDYNSYATGAVSFDGDAGGFIGFDDCGDADNLFYDQDTTGMTTSDIGTEKHTNEMTGVENIATYTNTSTSDGLVYSWDFDGEVNNDNNNDDIWTFVAGENDDYPVFNWQEFAPEVPETGGSVTTTETPTGKAVTLDWTGTCDLDTFTVKAESANAVQDVAFAYPNGLVNFTLTGCAGASTTITLTYAGVTNASYLVRKYMPSTGAYATVTAATLTATTIDGEPAIQATYVVQDNGPLDTNSATGTISDPAGIAQAVLGAPQTGAGGTYGV